jgi:hypothetical protein
MNSRHGGNKAMRGTTIGLIALTGVLLAAQPALAQQPPMTELEQAMGRRKTAPEIPPALRPMVQEATANRLLVRSLDGGTIEVDISEMVPADFEAFGGGRFLGFVFSGYEDFGYVLIDRAARGEAARIETGAKPVFSPAGRHFAAVQLSGSGWGNLEGLGIWEVSPRAVTQRLFFSALPAGEDWRIDGWRRAGCLALSAAPMNAEPTTPRLQFALDYGPRIAFVQTENDAACTGIVEAASV